MKIAIGCDHTGKEHLEAAKKVLDDFIEFDGEDYAEVAIKAARAVAEGRAERAVLICGTGIGMAIAANKVKGIRAAVCNTPELAAISRKHNDSNVLAIGARIISVSDVDQIIGAWKNTDFEGGRHTFRLNKIAAEERAAFSTSSAERLTVFNHPLVQHKVSMMRDKNTSVKDFRELVKEIAGLMVYEITRDLPTTRINVETPLTVTEAVACEGRSIAIIPILRAGIGMVDGILQLIPNAKVGHIGLYRDPETLNPVEYYCKLPSDLGEREILILDPMLATGGSAVAGIQLVKDRGGKRISFVCMIAAPEGIKKVQDAHPDVPIFAAALDSHLNDHGYIVPGLGDAGDRLFGTK